MGLVGKVVPSEHLMDESMALATTMTSKGPTAIRLVKRMINAATTAQTRDLCMLESEMVAAFYGSENPFEEGLAAYKEKRKARFTTER